ncbi:hypothetical protein NVP1208B_24 [Vibrio phage 1.208.B._10N.222.52.A7]|nr:hypothetical protein NVP1208B_24 [Vibrio phage 1.208.B._10N.222.52.A7]
MAQTILHKRSSTASDTPTTGDLALGELAINTTDGKLFFKKDDGSESIVEIGEAGTAPVSSVFGRTGAVVAESGDYSSFYLSDINSESIGDLSDVTLAGITNGQVLSWSGSALTPTTLLSEFTELTDTPSTLSGAGTQLVAVNAGGTALEFVDTIDGGSF